LMSLGMAKTFAMGTIGGGLGSHYAIISQNVK